MREQHSSNRLASDYHVRSPPTTTRVETVTCLSHGRACSRSTKNVERVQRTPKARWQVLVAASHGLRWRDEVKLHQRCGYSDSPFARVLFYTAGPKILMDWKGWTSGNVKGFGSRDQVGCASSQLDNGFHIPSRRIAGNPFLDPAA